MDRYGRTVVNGPIAYTYEADYHCEACAEARFGMNYADAVAGDAIDAEGNRVGVVAPWDEWQSFTGDCEVLACGTCGVVLDEYVPA
jgi:hypothetical protein